MAKSTLIGSLKISLLAVTKGYTKGLGRASRSTKKFTRLLRTNVTTALGAAAAKLTLFGLRGLGSIPGLIVKALKALAKLVKMLAITLVAAAGAATVALALLAKNSLKDLDRLAKSSRIIGLTVNELKALELAAGEAGVETKVLEKSLRNMTRQVNDAAKGTGEAVDALRDLGLDAKKIAAQSIPEQFMAIADALAEVKDKGERIQLAFDLFGGRGLSLLNLTSDAIRNASDELERMGLTISDLDTKKIEKFNDSVGDLKRAFKGVGDQIAIRLAPIIGGIVARMITLIESLGGINTIVGDLIASASVQSIKALNSIGVAFQNVVNFMQANSETIASVFSKIVGASFSAAEFIVNAFAVMAAGLDAIWATVKFTYFGVLSAMSQATLIMVEGVIDLLNKIPGVDLGVPDTLRAFVDIVAADTEKAAKEMGQKVGDVLFGRLDSSLLKIGLKIGITGAQATASIDAIGKSATVVFTEMAARLEALGPIGVELAAQLSALRADFDAMGAASREAAEEFEEGVGEAGKATNKLGKTIDQMADGIATSLTKGESAFESLRNVALSVIDDIAKSFIKSQIFGFLGSIFTGGGAIGTAIGGLAGKSTASTSRAAFSAPSLVPSAAGGGEVHINFFGPTSGDDAIEKAVIRGITEAQPALTSAAVGAVVDRKKRDPSFLR